MQRQIEPIAAFSYLLDGAALIDIQMKIAMSGGKAVSLNFESLTSLTDQLISYNLDETELIDIVSKADSNHKLALLKGPTGLFFIKHTVSAQVMAIEPHFNAQSIRFQCEYLLSTLFKHSEVRPHENISRQCQLRLETELFVCESTTYYPMCSHSRDAIKVLISLAVSATQLALLIVLSIEEPLRVHLPITLKQVIPHVFMALYLSFHITNSISEVAITAVGADNTGPATLFNIAAFSIRFSLNCCRLLYVLCTHVNQPLSAEFLSCLCMVIEFTIIGLLVTTTSVVISQQTTPVGMIANFVGLLLILDLDDMIASNIKHKSFKKVLSYENHNESDDEKLERERQAPFGKFMMSMLLFSALLILLIVT